jgi:hypothetical protein
MPIASFSSFHDREFYAHLQREFAATNPNGHTREAGECVVNGKRCKITISRHISRNIFRRGAMETKVIIEPVAEKKSEQSNKKTFNSSKGNVTFHIYTDRKTNLYLSGHNQKHINTIALDDIEEKIKKKEKELEKLEKIAAKAPSPVSTETPETTATLAPASSSIPRVLAFRDIDEQLKDMATRAAQSNEPVYGEVIVQGKHCNTQYSIIVSKNPKNKKKLTVEIKNNDIIPDDEVFKIKRINKKRFKAPIKFSLSISDIPKNGVAKKLKENEWKLLLRQRNAERLAKQLAITDTASIIKKEMEDKIANEEFNNPGDQSSDIDDTDPINKNENIFRSECEDEDENTPQPWS